jgi:hypothetical protein
MAVAGKHVSRSTEQRLSRLVPRDRTHENSSLALWAQYIIDVHYLVTVCKKEIFSPNCQTCTYKQNKLRGP